MHGWHQSEPLNSSTTSLCSVLARWISAARFTGGASDTFNGPPCRQPGTSSAIIAARKKSRFTKTSSHRRLRLSGFNPFSSHDGRDRGALERPAVKRAVRRFAAGFLPLEFPFPIQVDDRDVRIGADGERSLLEIQQSRGSHGEFGDDVG